MSARKKVLSGGGLLLTLLVVIYLNHFDNGFYFDDIHTIVDNEAIRSLDNIPRFFTDISTFGTMPNNRGYRPVVTLLNALDYRLAGQELNPVVFHLSIFFWYLVQGVLLYLLYLVIFRKTSDDANLPLVALLTTAFYMFHTANAETVNYIIARSDSFSALCIVATLVLFQKPSCRRWLVYLVPLLVGLLTKEVVLMVVPLLGLYSLYFEEEFVLGQLRRLEGWAKFGRAAVRALPALVLGLGVTIFNLFYMTDPSRVSGGLAHPRLDYFSSQFVVVAHYLGNFILPLDLSADPDFKVTPDFFTWEKMGSFGLIAALHVLALFCATKKRYLPISYGIIWFFVTLVPTSTLNPLYQVANDHRTFLPYIGLTMALGWSLFLAYRRWRLRYLPVLLVGLILCHGYGVYRRNQVWGSAETLWRDAATKSPENGRALMNYGLVLMGKGDYFEAEKYFTQALVYRPNWPYTNINMAVLKNAMGKPEEAEQYFLAALNCGRDNPEPYYYYARWLSEKGDVAKAVEYLKEGREVSPEHARIRVLLTNLEKPLEDKIQEMRVKVEANPNANDFIDLSLLFYRNQEFQKCIEACREALELEPKSAVAYNNICSAFIALEEWDKAVEAGQRALEIDPDFERARNNLALAEQRLAARTDSSSP